MNLKDFKKSGHLPTLVASFLYFDFSFMVWVTLGPLMVYIGKDLGLGVEDKFTLVAIPILAGAVLRVLMGVCCDQVGAKATGAVAQLVVIGGIAYAWLIGLGSVGEVQMLGVALGVAGASFAVALPQASRWYPPRYQGVVMGIAGAGNIGTVVDALLVPSLAERYGWQNALGFLLIPLVFTLLFYVAFSKEAPRAITGERKPITLATYREILSDQDSWWFMFFYFITFGGFVGLANSLSLYFTIQYHVSGVAAGLMVAIVVAFGSVFRPVGGYVADRIGGVRTLLSLFSIVCLAYLGISFMPAGPAPAEAGAAWSIATMPAIAWASVGLFSLGVLCLGMGNGAVFQLLPQRFRHEVGIMTGLVGCFGGIGGFFLARTLGAAKAMTGQFGPGFIFFSLIVLIGLTSLTAVKKRWRITWGAASGARI